jgi:hypothetical protein
VPDELTLHRFPPPWTVDKTCRLVPARFQLEAVAQTSK